MPFGSNFNTPVKLGDELKLAGHSHGILGAEVVARHVVLQQGTTVVSGPASKHPTWVTFPALPAEGFTEGDAMAVASETYLIAAAATFTTVTWSQVVRLERE